MKKLRVDCDGTSLVCLHIYASAFNKLELLCTDYASRGLSYISLDYF
jgi:hypothetical protein